MYLAVYKPFGAPSKTFLKSNGNIFMTKEQLILSIRSMCNANPLTLDIYDVGEPKQVKLDYNIENMED